MVVNSSKILPHAFVVGETELKKLVAILKSYASSVSIRTDCADGSSRTFETVEELVTYENPKSKEINRIHLIAPLHDFSKSARISLPAFSGRGIMIDFTGSEDYVHQLREKSLDILVGMRPWYDILARIASVPRLFICFLTVYPTLRLINLYVNTIRTNTKLSTTIVLLVAVMGLFTSIFFGIKLVRSIFPCAVFTIGQGKKRFKDKEQIQWGVVVAFVVSIAAGLVFLLPKFAIVMWNAFAG